MENVGYIKKTKQNKTKQNKTKQNKTHLRALTILSVHELRPIQ
jgi:hypothetical protein